MRNERNYEFVWFLIFKKKFIVLIFFFRMVIIVIMVVSECESIGNFVFF